MLVNVDAPESIENDNVWLIPVLAGAGGVLLLCSIGACIAFVIKTKGKSSESNDNTVNTGYYGGVDGVPTPQYGSARQRFLIFPNFCKINSKNENIYCFVFQ